jgi:hypothetical protein
MLESKRHHEEERNDLERQKEAFKKNEQMRFEFEQYMNKY